MKSKRIFKSLNLAIIVISILVVLVGGYNIFTVLSGGNIKAAEKDDSLKNEYYIVGRAPTPYQIENFELLSNELKKESRDDATISDLIVRAFIIEFFTWSNKKGAWDVGGQQYIYNYGLFYDQAIYTYYKDIDTFIEAYGNENLPEVVSITTTDAQSSPETVDEQTYDGYYIEATWEYKTSNAFDVSQFQRQAFFKVIILEDGKYEIVWFFDQW